VIRWHVALKISMYPRTFHLTNTKACFSILAPTQLDQFQDQLIYLYRIPFHNIMSDGANKRKQGPGGSGPANKKSKVGQMNRSIPPSKPLSPTPRIQIPFRLRMICQNKSADHLHREAALASGRRHTKRPNKLKRWSWEELWRSTMPGSGSHTPGA
jgi:hypothetical protein